MGLITWIILGALAGWIASMIAGTNGEQGAIGNIVVGIVGALLGGLISSALGGPAVSGFNLTSIVIAIMGAVILLFVVGMFRRGAVRQ
jgi:uncharacterized membrane protein YeaQ/YmgE (transglycosylase-associated protein family)